MKCIECRKKIGVLDDKCPHCGAIQYDDEPTMERLVVGFEPRIKEKKPIFSKEECFLYGIHPNDEMYRKTMELDILSKNYNA